MAQNIVINTIAYQDVPGIDVPKTGGGLARFYDTASGNLVSADLLEGKQGFGADGPVTGSMPENGAVGGNISTKAGTVVIPAGHTTGGSVGISSAEQAKIIGSNIKSGVTILGIQGSLTQPTISQDSTTKILSIS